ncbi:hypothetical protein Tco_0711570 [Tanacetum coccineum]
MVAFLDNPAESDGFHEIIDFLNGNQIRYALTVNPIIYTSCIQQFWARQRQTLSMVNVLDLEKAKEIADLKKRVQKLERKKKLRTTGFKRLRKVGESRRVKSSEDKEVVVKTNQSAKEREVDTSVEDSAAPTTIKEITLAQTLIQIKQLNLKLLPTVATTTTTTRPKAKGVVVQEPMEAKLIEKKALQGKRKKKPTRFDDHGNNNTSNHGAEFEKKHFAMLRAEEKRRKPSTKAQKRNLMSTYLKNMGGYKHNQFKNKRYDEIHMDVVKSKKEIEESSKGTEDELKSDKSKKAESSEEKAKGNRKKMLGKKRAGKEQQQESSKKQRMKDDKEQGEAWKKVDEEGICHIAIGKEQMRSSKRYSSMIRMLQVMFETDIKVMNGEILTRIPSDYGKWFDSYRVHFAKVQLNELNELRDEAYENSLIYKEKTKRIHDSKIKNRVFNVGDRVLLFNSRLKIFSGKLKTRWSGPFTITQVFPYGTVELSQNSGPNFKVNGHRIKHYFGGDVPQLVVPDLQTFPNVQ